MYRERRIAAFLLAEVKTKCISLYLAFSGSRFFYYNTNSNIVKIHWGDGWHKVEHFLILIRQKHTQGYNTILTQDYSLNT